MSKRIFIIVLDSFGVGELPDASSYGDEGSNTLKGISVSSFFAVPNLAKAGLFCIDGVADDFPEEAANCVPEAAYGRMAEASKGKDTTTGHWELAGIISHQPMPVYPNGFPPEIIREFECRTGHKTLCNLPYSGTDVINDFGEEHVATKALIVYTSADSVFQIAAHEEIIPLDLLYDYCRVARGILRGAHSVGRVIARPFTGTAGHFKRTENRHDFSLEPEYDTMLDCLSRSGLQVISIGKISDIFAGRGITGSVASKNNHEGVSALLEVMGREFDGLCFLNLVDFDMLYGHRNDIDGYAKAIADFDHAMPEILDHLKEDDLLIVTADHGCDPSTPGTDHSREYVPLLVFGKGVLPANLGTRATFADLAATVLDRFGIKGDISGNSFLPMMQQ
ncbi:MAG: phosphopentomutase [Saccharofermentanales bacterium]